MDLVVKTIEYRVAEFFGSDSNQVLEDLTRQAWSKFSDSDGRTIEISGNLFHRGLQASDIHTGFAIHCARYRENQPMGTISDKPMPKVDVKEFRLTDGQHFIGTDFMAIIKGNNVICLNCHVGARRLQAYLKDLFEKAKMPDEAEKFLLARVGNFNKISKIKFHGVKRVDYNVYMTDLIASHLDDITPSKKSPSYQIKKAFGSLFGNIKSLKDIRNSEQGKLSIGLTIPNGDTEVAKQSIEDFAKQVVREDENESFTIHLKKNGGKIMSDELAVTKKVSIKPWANTVDVLDAWQKMSNYMDEVLVDYSPAARRTT